MAVTRETTTVYRGGGRRWLTLKAAVKAEAVRIIKGKYPTERFDSETGDGFHWRELKRSEVLLRRMCRLVSVSANPQAKEQK